MKKISVIFLTLAFLASPLFARAAAAKAIKFQKFSEYETVLKIKIDEINITLFAEKTGGGKIQLQELAYFKRIIKSSLKHFPEFREERFPKPRPLKRRAGKTNLEVAVIAGEETKLSICSAAGYSPSECAMINAMHDREGNAIFLFSDSPLYYNFMFESATMIHEMFHFQTTLYNELTNAEFEKIEEDLAKIFETYVFFRMQIE